MRLTDKIDDIERIILDFNAPFTESIIKSILLLMQYFNNNNLSIDNQISNVEIISIDEGLSSQDQQDSLENLILSSIPQENLSISLFAIYFKDHWNSFVTYNNENKIYAKYNDSRGNKAPDLLKKVLSGLQSDGIIDMWEDCRTTIPGGRSNDSGPKTIRNLLEMVYKPTDLLKNSEMPLKYYGILRISYVICYLFVEILDTLETRAYLSDLLQTTHNLPDIEHKIDWLEELIKDICLSIKDNNPPPNYAKILNACEEALKDLSSTPGFFDQDPIPQNIKERTATDINLLYTQTLSKIDNISLEGAKKDRISLEPYDLDESISPLRLEAFENSSHTLSTRTGSKDFITSHTNPTSILNQTSPARIETEALHLGKVTRNIAPGLSNTTPVPIREKSASFDETIGHAPPFGTRFISTRSLSAGVIEEPFDTKNASGNPKTSNDKDAALDDARDVVLAFSESGPKSSKIKSASLKSTLANLSPSKILKEYSSSIPKISKPLLDDSLSQSRDIDILTHSLNLSTNSLFMQTIGGMDNDKDDNDMLNTINLASTLRENEQDLHDDVQKDFSPKFLIGETPPGCKTH